MNKAIIMKAAHRVAKTFVGDYSACFALALKTIYAQIKSGHKLFEVTARKQMNSLLRLPGINKNDGQEVRFVFAKDEWSAATKVITMLNNNADRAYFTEACCDIEVA